jgi:hypothetical protein
MLRSVKLQEQFLPLEGGGKVGVGKAETTRYHYTPLPYTPPTRRGEVEISRTYPPQVKGSVTIKSLSITFER